MLGSRIEGQGTKINYIYSLAVNNPKKGNAKNFIYNCITKNKILT